MHQKFFAALSWGARVHAKKASEPAKCAGFVSFQQFSYFPAGMRVAKNRKTIINGCRDEETTI
jgi:hypothetical protein